MEDRAAKSLLKTRLIAELRYDVIPQFIDRRGELIGTVHPEIRKRFRDWESTQEQVLFTNDRMKPTAEVLIGAQRMSIILEDPDSLDEFSALTDKILGFGYQFLGRWLKDVSRIGVRSISIIRSPCASYEETAKHVLHKLHKADAIALPLEISDSQAILVHKYGRLGVGPTHKADEWIVQLFKDPLKNVPDFGIAADIDSFAANVAVSSVQDLKANVHAVLNMTRAVEEKVVAAVGATA